jgi:hypothetical protein
MIDTYFSLISGNISILFIFGFDIRFFSVSETDLTFLWRLWCFVRCFVVKDQISSSGTFFFLEILVSSNCLVARCDHRFSSQNV